MALQTYMLSQTTGQWSGFKRPMELAEAFLLPLVTVSTPQISFSREAVFQRDFQMIRRAGSFYAPADSPALMPARSDTPEVLETKWKQFIRRESYKRCVAV